MDDRIDRYTLIYTVFKFLVIRIRFCGGR